MSIEYIPFEADLVWLDPDLVLVSSANFLSSVRDAGRSNDVLQILSILDRYAGSFAPEFEYEEWAIAWRTRVQVAFLEFSHTSVSSLLQQQRFADARDVALRALETEPEARDVERKLVAIYWKLGSRAAAAAQYEHFASQERSDGVEPPSLDELCEEEIPEP